MSTVTTQLNSGSTGISVSEGGTGVNTLTTANAPICAGTAATGALQVASSGLSSSATVLTSTGSSSLPTFQSHNVSKTVVTLATSDVQNMFNTPFLIVPAQGAHTLIVIYYGIFEYYGSVAFSNGSLSGFGPVIQYTNTASALGTLGCVSYLDITGAPGQIAYSGGDDSSSFCGVLANVASDVVNQGLYVSNDGSSYTGGNASLKITLYYNVFNTTV